MATLDLLKQTLRQQATARLPAATESLSDSQYDAGFAFITEKSGHTTYQDFIIPQLAAVLKPLFASRVTLSILEIGPGPESVLRSLPAYMRRRISRYVAFEPNQLFASKLQVSLDSEDSPLPGLDGHSKIHPTRFQLDSSTLLDGLEGSEKFDIVLFCHSMYGMEPKRRFIEHALEMLEGEATGAQVIVFHRDGTLDFEKLVCHQTSSFPTGVVSIPDEDDKLDCFAQFIVGSAVEDQSTEYDILSHWRQTCRALARREESHPGRLFFDAPETMVTFTKDSTALPKLAAKVLVARMDNRVKNREARTYQPASIMRPESIQQVQECVRWALKQNAALTVLGGSHSGQCVWPNVVAVDMSAFGNISIVDHRCALADRSDLERLVVVGAGCTTGDIIRATMADGITVPLGSRPSVGVGLILQGGIGHLTRQHGLACDSIVGAVVISVASGDILCVGEVPNQPPGSVRPANSSELLWALKGAGTNFGIVTSLVLKAYEAPTYDVRNWIVPLSSSCDARQNLCSLEYNLAGHLPRYSSADAYLYCEGEQLHLGVNVFNTSVLEHGPASFSQAETAFGPASSSKTIDSVGLFDAEMYMSSMHGGHSGGKTSSFKRCVFLKGVGKADVSRELVTAVHNRPTPRCYLHLLHAGGALADVSAHATAFDRRDWEYACVITGVWGRAEDGSRTARAAIQWVYDVARNLLPLSVGVYGADLGPDPRDAELAAKAFGPSTLTSLALLKQREDPSNVLAFACPMPKPQAAQKLIILVTGEPGAGKDYCADIWSSTMNTHGCKSAALSISDATKREYAASTGANFRRLIEDRTYKEQHRPALTAYFQEQVQKRPRIPDEHFLSLVSNAVHIDVLFITGMRDLNPVATFSYLVPDRRLIEVRVEASSSNRQARRGGTAASVSGGENCGDHDRPDYVSNNNADEEGSPKAFMQEHLRPLIDDKLQKLAAMVRSIAHFPRPGIQFRDVLGIASHSDGLTLCTSLLQDHYAGDWAATKAIACCEVGGLVFASTLCAALQLPLIQIREAGKLPPPTVSVTKAASHVSALESVVAVQKKMEMPQGFLSSGDSVAVVDDVLATGETLCAVLELLKTAGIKAANISVLVVAEFPVHRGRALLRQRGHGGVRIQSLMVFDGE